MFSTMRQPNTMLDEPSVAVLRALRPGEVVTLPDGEQAMVMSEAHGRVEVVQPQKLVGRGPWVFWRYQVEVAS